MSARKRHAPRYCFELYEVLLCCWLVGLLIGALAYCAGYSLGVADLVQRLREVRR